MSSISRIHRAIRDGHFDFVEELVGDDYHLIGKQNAIGWNALHFGASNEELSLEQWHWILQHSPPGATKQRTESGHTCIDHFFFRWLNPPSWQRRSLHGQAAELKAALSMVSNDVTLLSKFQANLYNENYEADGQGDQVQCVLNFWRRLDMLLRIDYWGTLDSGGRLPVLFALARTSCPREVAVLAVRSFYHQESPEMEKPNLPLHVVCANPSPGALLDVLVVPETACQTGAEGRLPLHIALHSGALTWDRGISALWNAYPLYGSPLDNATNLPAVLLACCPDSKTKQGKILQRAARLNPGMWQFLNPTSRQRILDIATAEVELAHLETVFQLLRADPTLLR